MTLDKQIAEQMERVRALQKDVFARDPTKEDAKRPAELKKQRATGVREAISRVQKEKKAAIERYDAEIKSLEDELNGLEKHTDLDFTAKQGGGVTGGRVITTKKKSTLTRRTTR